MSQCIQGFFLSFSDADYAEICSNLVHDGYSGDNDGLKAYIIETLTGMEEDEEDEPQTHDKRAEILRRGMEYIREHPEQVEFYKQKLGSAFSHLFKK